MLTIVGGRDVTRILSAIDGADPQAASRLLPLVYDELRKLAACRLAQEQPGQTLQATALVHDAYLRLVGGDGGDADVPRWNGRGHFFAAAAEAMRRILVEAARRRQRIKRGGGVGRERLDAAEIAAPADAPDDLLGLDAALDRLEGADPVAAQLVKLRYFAGLTIPQAAEALGVSPRKADFLWSFARAWLRREMGSA